MIQIPRIIKENPFRILGLYSNSGAREQSLNAVKISRYSAVGKAISFPTDLSSILGDVNRTSSSVEEASREIQLNSERVVFALFWLMKDGCSPVEEDALSALFAGDIDKALDIFERINTPSALIDASYIFLLKGNLKDSIIRTWKIISNERMRNLFLEEVCGDLYVVEQEELAKKYLEVLKSEFPVQTIYAAIARVTELSALSDILAKELGKGIQDKITARVTETKTGNNTAEEWCTAGVKLIDDTKEALDELGEITLDGGLEKQLYADKVANQALQCVINAYNIAFEQVGKDNGSLLQAIIPKCLDIINRIDTTQLSPVVKERIKSNKEGIDKVSKEGVKNLVMYAIANDTSKCFFCGASASGTRQFSFKKEVRTRISYNKERVTTYTKGLNVPICPECRNAFDKKEKWRETVTWAFTAIAFAVAAFFLFRDSDMGIFGTLVVLALFGFGLSFLVGTLLSAIFARPLQWLFDRKSIRKFKRSISDHPAVKEINRQGYY